MTSRRSTKDNQISSKIECKISVQIGVQISSKIECKISVQISVQISGKMGSKYYLFRTVLKSDFDLSDFLSDSSKSDPNFLKASEPGRRRFSGIGLIEISYENKIKFMEKKINYYRNSILTSCSILTCSNLTATTGKLVVGASVGTAVGENDGFELGDCVGSAVGIDVGVAVGIAFGSDVGIDVGVAVGIAVGSDVGVDVGMAVGIIVGSGVGVAVADGADVGVAVGIIVGSADGIDEGMAVGIIVSSAVGVAVANGADVGVDVITIVGSADRKSTRLNSSHRR